MIIGTRCRVNGAFVYSRLGAGRGPVKRKGAAAAEIVIARYKQVFTGTKACVHTRWCARDEINKDKRATAEKVPLEPVIMYSCTAEFNERLRFV